MNSSLIGKIEKAKRYTQEPDRIKFTGLAAQFHGSHDDYAVSLKGDEWTCTCHTFATGFETCSHIMAIQRILHDMLTEDARSSHAEYIEPIRLVEVAAVN